MACSIEIKAKNGNPSNLFSDLLDNSSSVEEAVKSYLKFKDVPTSNVDENGEPKYSVIQKIQSNIKSIIDLEKSSGLRNRDGSRKRYISWNTATDKARTLNKDLNLLGYTARVIKVMGEKGDTRVYYALEIVPLSQGYDVLGDDVNLTEDQTTLITEATNLKKIEAFKKLEKEKIEDKLKEARSKKNSTTWHVGLNGPQILAELAKIHDTIERLTDRKIALNQTFPDEYHQDMLKYFLATFNMDKSYIEKLLSSDDLNDIIMAKDIINMYVAMGNFQTDLDNHPLYTREAIEDPEVIPDSFKRLLKEMSTEAEGYLKLYDDRFKDKLQKAALEHVDYFEKNGIPPGELTTEKLIAALKDITKADKWFFDAATNPFSEKQSLLSTLILRIMKEATQKATQKSVAQVNAFQVILDKASKRLKELGYTDKNLYDLFKQREPGGVWNGRLVDLFSEEYYSTKYKYLNDMKNSIATAYTNYFTAKRDKASDDIQNALLDLAKDLERQRKDWWNNTHIFLDVSKLSDLHGEFADVIDGIAPDDAYRASIIDEVGQKTYDRLLETQREKLREFRKEREINEEWINGLGLSEVQAKRKFALWNALHNPQIYQSWLAGNPIEVSSPGLPTVSLETAYKYELYQKKVADLDSSLTGAALQAAKDNAKFRASMEVDTHGVKFDTSATVAAPRVKNLMGDDTNFYDKNFATIESDPILTDFYNSMTGIMRELHEAMPHFATKSFSMNSLPMIKRTFLEELLQDGNSMLDVVKRGGTVLNDMFVNAISERVGPGRKSASEFAESEMDEVNYDFLNKVDGLIEPVVSRLTKEYIQNTGIEPNAAMKKEFKIQAMREVLPEYSFDLGQVMAFYINAANLANVRASVLPALNALKYVFNTQQVDEQGNQRLEDMEKMAHTFKVFTGQASNDKELVSDKVVLDSADKKELLKLQEIGISAGIPLTSMIPGTKALKDEIENITQEIADIAAHISNLEATSTGTEEDQDVILAEQIKLNKKRNSIGVLYLIDRLGQTVTGSATANSALSFMRFLGLGWNLGSVIPNMAAGYYANFSMAARQDKLADGTNLVTMGGMTRAYKLITDSIVKNLTFSKVVTDTAKKIGAIMKSADYLSDSSNEFNKASQVSAITGKLEWTHYFTPNKRQEYVNQSTLVMARYMEVPIVSKTGEVSNLYDALDMDGKLKEEFQTEVNLNKFDINSKFMLDLILQIKEMINRNHGDYTQLGRMNASTTILGRFVTFMKKWMASAVDNRFATERQNFDIGIKTKGRYRSYDKNSLAVLGAGLGLVTLGLPGLVVMGGLSYFVGEVVGNKAVTSPVPFLKSLQYLGQRLLFSRMMWFSPTKYSDKLGNQYNEHFTPVDAANMRANMQELSHIITLFTMYILAKLALFDPDDEKEDARRVAHNLIINQLLKVNKDLYYFSSMKSPGEFVGNAFPIARLIKNSTAVLESTGKLIIQKPLRSNENTLGDNVTKFMPNIFRLALRELPFTKGDLMKPTTEPTAVKYLLETNEEPDGE